MTNKSRSSTTIITRSGGRRQDIKSKKHNKERPRWDLPIEYKKELIRHEYKNNK